VPFVMVEKVEVTLASFAATLGRLVDAFDDAVLQAPVA
jgi:hypothetical protein